MKYTPRVLFALALPAVIFLSGCPKAPDLGVDPKVINLAFDPVTGTYDTVGQFHVFNSGSEDTTLVFSVQSNEGWLHVSPAGGESTGEDDRVAITVTVDRDYIEMAKAQPAHAVGTITVESSVGRETVIVTTAPNYFTEQFLDGTDLEGRTLTFTPSGGPSFYTQTRTDGMSDFPTDPTGGLVLDFDAFGDPVLASPFGGLQVPFYGQNYDSLYISSQGYIAFGGPGNDPSSLERHFEDPQISALPVDARQPGSMVSFLQDEDKLSITYENVPTQGDPSSSNDFQIELFFDGTIRLTYINVDPKLSGVIGLSSGDGNGITTPPGFVESDLTDVNTGPLKAAF